MPLPHFTQLQGVGSPGGPGTLPNEVVHLNLFEITFVLPVVLQAQGRDPFLLMENATKVSLNLTETEGVDSKVQRFKYSTREYVTTPTKTSGKISIPIQVSVNQQGSIENYTTMKAWYDLAFNSQNGTLHYKSDMIGTIIVTQHDRKGVVLRRVTFQNCQILKLSGYELNWGSNDILNEVTADFVYDYFIDEYVDGNFSFDNPVVGGY